MTARADEVAKFVDGRPVAGQTDYRVDVEKGTPFIFDATVRMRGADCPAGAPPPHPQDTAGQPAVLDVGPAVDAWPGTAVQQGAEEQGVALGGEVARASPAVTAPPPPSPRVLAPHLQRLPAGHGISPNTGASTV